MEGKPALTTEDSALEQMMQVCKPIFSFKHLGSYNIIYVLPYKRIKILIYLFVYALKDLGNSKFILFLC